MRIERTAVEANLDFAGYLVTVRIAASFKAIAGSQPDLVEIVAEGVSRVQVIGSANGQRARDEQLLMVINHSRRAQQRQGESQIGEYGNPSGLCTGHDCRQARRVSQT